LLDHCPVEVHTVICCFGSSTSAAHISGKRYDIHFKGFDLHLYFLNYVAKLFVAGDSVEDFQTSHRRFEYECRVMRMIFLVDEVDESGKTDSSKELANQAKFKYVRGDLGGIQELLRIPVSRIYRLCASTVPHQHDRPRHPWRSRVVSPVVNLPSNQACKISLRGHW